jgi:hypothetical protein
MHIDYNLLFKTKCHVVWTILSFENFTFTQGNVIYNFLVYLYLIITYSFSQFSSRFGSTHQQQRQSGGNFSYDGI